MPELFDEVVLLVDCRIIDVVGAAPTFMPRGSRGILIDQNTTYPHIWMIEIHTERIRTEPEGIEAWASVLVEVDDKSFSVSKPFSGWQSGSQ